MATDKVQVVFMADTALPYSEPDSVRQHYRSICLAAVRILLYLSQFPIKEHLNRVLWNFKLFSSEKAECSTKTWQFHENRSELIEKFFQKLQESFESLDKTTNLRNRNTGIQRPVKLVYNALAAIIQDFVWDAPEIMSPVRPKRRGRVAGRKMASDLSSRRPEDQGRERNIIVILSNCPVNDSDLRKFCYGSKVNQDPVTMATIREQLFPPALLTQLTMKGIAVHWVHTGALSEPGDIDMVPQGLTLMSEVLKKAGGTLIPLSTLVTPLAPQLQIQKSSPAPLPHSMPSSPVECQAHEDLPSSLSNSACPSSPMDTRSVTSVESEAMRAPSLPKTRPTSFPSKEFLSTLVLPASSLLQEYLGPRAGGVGGGDSGGCRGVDGGGSNRTAALRDNSLLWFSTRDGKVLFILKLHQMCRLLTPNLPLIRVTSHSSGSGTSKGRGNRSAVALGLVRQADIPLSWLDPSSTFSCSGLYVPRKTRSNLRTLAKNNKGFRLVDDDTIGDENFNDLKSVNPPLLTSPTCTNKSTFKKPTSKSPGSSLPPRALPPTASSPSHFLGLNLVPVLRLDKHPLLPPFTNRPMKRSSSVPKEVACSSEGGSVLERENDNETNSSPKFSRKIKKFNSLPSTPVVLCNKLPLLRLQGRPSSTQDQDGGASSSSSGDALARPLSAIFSPKLLQLKMSKVQAQRESQESEDHCLPLPEESLKKSGRYSSKQYLNLSLWLAKNSLLLVVRIDLEEGSCLGVLQPVTSLVSTLSLLKPQHHRQLLKKLINPPLDSAGAKVLSVPLRSSSKKHLSKKEEGRKIRATAEVVQVKAGPQETDITLPGSLPGNSDVRLDRGAEEDPFITSCASDCELYTGLQLLFKRKSGQGFSSDSVQSSLLGAMVEAPPFTHLPLLPWFPYTQCCSVTHQDIERLQELQLDVKDSEYGEVQRKTRLLSALKELYSCGRVAAASSEREDSETLTFQQEEEDGVQLQDEAKLDEGETGSDALSDVSSVEELCQWLLSRYEEQVRLCPDGDSLLRWSSKILAQFQTSMRQLLSLEQAPKDLQNNLWKQLQTSVLLSSAQLGEKYVKMEKEEEEAAQEKGKEKEVSSLNERKITEHLLQILLHFEAVKVCQDVEVDVKLTSNTLVLLFRKLSLLANPGLVGSCLKKTILPVYLSSCQDILTEVYDRLMLPLPSDLTSSPDRPLSPDPSAEEGESSEEFTPLLSLDEPPAAPKLADLGAKRLARHMSFHDNQSHRQITVLNKKKRKRKRHKHKDKSEAGNPPRRSPRIAKLAETDTQKGKSVCRSLFSRSLSFNYDVITKRKREREEQSDTENHPATKRRRGAHTLQRHHTVVEGASSGPHRSPRKSFYSGANVPRQKTTPLFKTPPLKESTSRVHLSMNPHVLLNKEPSPAAIFSLLHGQMVSPQDQQDTETTPPLKSTKDVASVVAATALTVSPRVKGTLRTPDSKGQARDLTFTPLAHRGANSLALPRDLSLMLSPGVLASYMVSNTPLSLARSVERGSSRLSTDSQSANVNEERGSTRKTGFKSARMLTYENEDPLLKKSRLNSCESPLKTFTIHNPLSQQHQHPAPATVSNKCTSPSTEIPLTLGGCLNQHKSLLPVSRVHGVPSSQIGRESEVVVLVTPPGSGDLGHPSCKDSDRAGNGVCLLTDLDPSIENESASMMAFALSTPTKDDPKDFLDAFG